MKKNEKKAYFLDFWLKNFKKTKLFGLEID